VPVNLSVGEREFRLLCELCSSCVTSWTCTRTLNWTVLSGDVRCLAASLAWELPYLSYLVNIVSW
jgi:hypothetical protein